MDFQKLLFHVSEALITDNLAALKFLCLDHISMKRLEAIHEPKAFFEALQEKDLINEGNLSFLKELLYRINRRDILAAHLRSSGEEVERELQIPGRTKVSAYRQLLYEIAEDLASGDVETVKLLVQKKIPKNKLQDNASMLQVFLEMQRLTIIKEDNLSVLKEIFKEFRVDIKKKIDAYEEKKKGYSWTDGKGTAVSATSLEMHTLRGSGRVQELFLCTHKSPEKSYEMKNNPHGYCVILNNYSFKNPHEVREGTEEDGEAVKRVFKWLQFETEDHMDLEAEQMYEIVKEYSKKDHSNMDCFVCFILSHGEKDKITGVDHKLVNIKDLVSCFSGSNCPSLAGKPKLFFIQACQGSVGHPPVTVKEDFSGRLETDATPLTSIPDLADILVGMATVEDYECYRDTETGSIYIQCLCDKLESLCPLRKDLVTILTEVNNEVGRKVLNGCKQMPKITSTLRKQLIFQV
ncbi:Caspase-8, partial [Apaloderma vittatum]